MNQFFIILLSLIIFSGLIIAAVIFYFSKKFREMEENRKGDGGMQMLNQNMQSLQQVVAEQIGNANKNINERLDNAARVIMSVNNELGQMKEIGANLKGIQDFLKSPKLRGNLGEQGLKELLTQSLPTKYFSIQYTFRSGTIVDAIIHLDAGKIPIDSKFPLENFNQMIKATNDADKSIYRRKFRDDFRRHVNAISKKYINPDEGTADFAFMYIPSESIYFEVVNNEQDLFEYAATSHVVLSSPSTFFYYLRTIMLGLEGKRITEMSREIIKALKTIKQQSNGLGENLSVLNRHITNANKTMTSVSDQYIKLSEKISRVDILEENQTKLLDGAIEE
ncbi:MAG: DNA recombination protein RmuC [Patescibacteria group bacterium]